MHTKFDHIFYIVASFLFLGCASYLPKYKNKENITDYSLPKNKAIEKTFYLIGDAGYASDQQSTSALVALKKHLQSQTKKDNYTIFLGDNIYPSGMPKKGAKNRKIAEHRLEAQIEAVQEFDGQVIFIPGNHDWYAKGLKGLARQEAYLEKQFKDKKVFRPSKGCALESIEVTDQIQLIILDSQWYLEDWDKHPTINDDCPQLKTREAVFLEIESEFKKNQDKTILFALHHPLYTNGVHGGKYAAVKHLYPSQKKVPLPVLGSLAMQIRTNGAISTQDLQNKHYKSLVKRLETLAKGETRIIFASGHEHSLQYIEHQGIKQIVSGSGAKNSFARLGNDGLFAFGGQGFAQLDIYKDGSSWISYYGSTNGVPVLLYTKEVYTKKSIFDTDTLSILQERTIKASVYAPETTERTGFYESIWGNHYRDLYGTQINAKVALLDTLYGGLNVVRKGGGHQTRSLRLEDKNGKQYNLRALQKSGIKFLQSTVFKDNYIEDSFEDTISEAILKDFYTAAHPYVFLTIPELSDAVGIFHTNPALFYIPKQKALGKHNIDHGDALYMIEERPEKHHKNLASFGRPDDIESTADVYERLRRDEKYKIDESAYIRARLFDMLIGDWDRHQDQWRWAEYKLEDGTHLFKPIPRDRDQAFSNFDGGFMGALRGLIGFANQFQEYEATLEDVKWINISAIRLDRTLLRNSMQAEWIAEAAYIQKHLTDARIEQAFMKIPVAARGEASKTLIEKLKGRRDQLQTIATAYSKHLAKLVILTGTDKDDYIEITRQKKGKTTIKMFRIKDGNKEDLFSDRTYTKKDTKEIWVYGLDDDDVFEVTGKVGNPIPIRLIGGQNNDRYTIKKGRGIKIYDYKSKPNTILRKGNAKLIRTDRYDINHFNKDGKVMRTTSILPKVGFNPDDGVLVGTSVTFTQNGFYRNPFTSRHRISGGYYFATQGFDLGYEGEFAGIFDNYNLRIDATYTSPNFAVNFFGFGNRSSNPQEALDFDYNRVKLSTYSLAVGVVKNGRLGSFFKYNVRFEGIEVDATANRFITASALALDPDFFERKWFAGIEGTYRYESYDITLNPTRGMKFEVVAGTKMNVENTQRTFGYIKPYLGFYNALSRSRKWVLKTASQAQFTIGRNYEFYQGATLGANHLLRGYRRERFIGQSMWAGSADIRYSFSQFKTRVLPLQIGVFVGGDVGRVWIKNEPNANIWHGDYGGGLWINSANAMNGTFNIFAGEDGPRFSFEFGFKF